jgi:hypothetical protein
MMFSEGGPPDPISYLRRVSKSEVGSDSTGKEELRRSDSADDADLLGSGEETERHTKAKQDPPARERPSDGEAWPHRDHLSFTSTSFIATLNLTISCRTN